ncbi:uncharacterized protein LOC142229813 [Haematobia irritans]|uniref:uncharacterized protein LOC142229813 n=1 Tax=Haematobia irritans TaxID=7368 RepID=UPI003F501305
MVIANTYAEFCVWAILLWSSSVVAHRSFYADDVNLLILDINSVLNDDVKVLDQMLYLGGYNLGNFSDGNQSICTYNTDLDSAVGTMRYHRQMMKKFMLSEYLVKQIADSALEIKQKTRIEKRMGAVTNESSETNGSGKLLLDEGSRQYSSWLRRLADIYNTTHKSRSNGQTDRQKLTHLKAVSSADRNDAADGMDYLEDADITGYAYTTDHSM